MSCCGSRKSKKSNEKKTLNFKLEENKSANFKYSQKGSMRSTHEEEKRFEKQIPEEFKQSEKYEYDDNKSIKSMNQEAKGYSSSKVLEQQASIIQAQKEEKQSWAGKTFQNLANSLKFAHSQQTAKNPSMSVLNGERTKLISNLRKLEDQQEQIKMKLQKVEISIAVAKSDQVEDFSQQQPQELANLDSNSVGSVDQLSIGEERYQI